MEIEVRVYTKELIQDVLDFEARLRKEEDFWGWEIDEKYIDGTASVLIMIQMMVYLNCTKHSFVFERVLFFVLKVGDELESMGLSNIYERKINDLVTGWIKKDGSVEEVLVEINDKEVPINKNQLYDLIQK